MKQIAVIKITLTALTAAVICLSACSRAQHTINIDNLADDTGRYMYNGIVWGSSVEDTSEKLGISFEEPMIGYAADGSDRESQNYIQKDCVKLTLNNQTYKGDTIVKFVDGSLINIAFYFKLPNDKSEIVLDELVGSLTDMYGEPMLPSGNNEPAAEDSGYDSYGWENDEESIVTTVAVRKIGAGDEDTGVVGINIGISHTPG